MLNQTHFAPCSHHHRQIESMGADSFLLFSINREAGTVRLQKQNVPLVLPPPPPPLVCEITVFLSRVLSLAFYERLSFKQPIIFPLAASLTKTRKYAFRNSLRNLALSRMVWVFLEYH